MPLAPRVHRLRSVSSRVNPFWAAPRRERCQLAGRVPYSMTRTGLRRGASLRR